jgi:glycosyltransferase involved in cell wall biosynthesis
MKTLSVIIPCYNEEKTLAEIVRRVRAVKLENISYEIIIVDDASKDKSREVIKMLPDVKALFHEKNQGKGKAVITGLKNATGDMVIIQDADLEYSPEDYPKLIAPLLEGYADVVYGSRFFGSAPHRVFNFHHYIANRSITFFSNIFTNLNLSDVEVGYKVFTKKVVEKIVPKLSSSRFGIEIELTARIARFHFRIYEVTISYKGRDYAEGKKIGWKDGVAALWFILYYNCIKR